MTLAFAVAAFDLIIDAVLFEAAQIVRQHLLADAGNAFEHLVELPGARKQVAEDQELPLVPDKLYCCGDRIFR